MGKAPEFKGACCQFPRLGRRIPAWSHSGDNAMARTARILLISTCLALCTACGSMREAQPVVEYAELVRVAPESIPEDELLDIDIRPFIPFAESFKARMNVVSAIDGLFGVDVPDTRNMRVAESHYLSRELGHKLQGSGHWGMVRMNPYGMSGADLEVTGTVEYSDGQSLRLHVQAHDSRGKLWLSRRYTQLSPSSTATSSVEDLAFPFDDIFNQIANDLAAARASALDSGDLDALRRYSTLKFAEALAPTVFAPYRDDDTIIRLPAQDDPVFQGVQEMRAGNDTFLDAMQLSYDLYVDQIARDYLRFLYVGSQVSAQLDEYLQTDDSARASNSLPTKNSRYMAVYELALADMSQPMQENVAPLTLEFGDRTARLNGTLENQFRQWQVILQDMYEMETGKPANEGQTDE